MGAPVEQIDRLLEEAGELLRASPHADYSGGSDAHRAEVAGFRIRLHAATDRLAPRGSAYAEAVRNVPALPYDGPAVVRYVSMLGALKADYEAGYMQTVEELIHSDLFADFLEMADELVGKGYKNAAAVIAGSTLEEHLRKLAARSGVAVEKSPGQPKKADTLNAEVVKAGTYNKLEQKSVTAWLDLRNKAAHGEYDEYDRPQVEALIRDVRSFMSRHPA